MVYKVIGMMSGSSLDGLDIAYVQLQERVSGSGSRSSQWAFELIHTDCYPYSAGWRDRLAGAPGLSALDYQLLHTEYGHYLGREVLRFIAAHGLEYRVQLIASHGHTAFHLPARRMTGKLGDVGPVGMTAQLGDGAAIAAETGINVVSELRAMDVALGGQGAPIVPIGERMLFPEYGAFLNLGGIANVSAVGAGERVAFDVCPANRVLNALAAEVGMAYDKDGALAAAGTLDEGLLARLNALPYYGMGYPKSLANEFGLEEVLPLVRGAGLRVEDGLRTYVEHVVEQIGRAMEITERSEVLGLRDERGEGVEGGRAGEEADAAGVRLLVTGGGSHNGFLIGRLRARLAEFGVAVVVPEAAIVDYKEALVMALIGVLRWREENNVLASVTGATRDSIGGAVWIGQGV